MIKKSPQIKILFLPNLHRIQRNAMRYFKLYKNILLDVIYVWKTMYIFLENKQALLQFKIFRIVKIFYILTSNNFMKKKPVKHFNLNVYVLWNWNFFIAKILFECLIKIRVWNILCLKNKIYSFEKKRIVLF